jgi:BlaI family transcriptional regulator, penicillinase repressor
VARNLRGYARGASPRDACRESTVGERLELGPLELKVLEVLWGRKRPSTVRHVQPSFPELAYTTLMTTLDRLYRKGVLRRLRLGRAFGYLPRCSRSELFGRMVSGRVTELLACCSDSTVLLSTLVAAVGDADAELLDELEALVRAERARLERGTG